jgi:hypothetical protein
LFSIFRLEASTSHRNKNAGTLNFYPQVRVAHISPPYADLRPLFVVSQMEEFLAQSRPLHGRRLIFSTVGFGGIRNRFFDIEMWADGRSNGLQLIARGADAVRINSRWKRPLTQRLH